MAIQSRSSIGPTDSQTTRQRTLDAPLHIFRACQERRTSSQPNLLTRSNSILDRKKKMPTLNTTQPLTLYLHAERRLSKDLTSLFKFHALFRRAPSSKLSRVHQAQRLLLDVIYLIYIEGDESIKAPRGHLAYLPPEDHSELLDNYSENILYAAQALQSGYKIRGIETFTEELLEPADHLIQAFTSLRVAFTERAMKDTRPPYRDLDPILQTFDSAWVSFEKAICYSYFTHAYHSRPFMSETTDMFQVLLSETLLDAVKKGLLNQDEVIEVDPRALIALPRLAIVKGILDMANLIDLSGRENKKMLFFKDKLTILDDVQEKLLALSRPELRAGLEKALCGFDEDALKDSLPCEIKPSQSETEDLAVLFRSISFLADDLLQSSPRSKEFHCIISRAMKMHST